MIFGIHSVIGALDADAPFVGVRAILRRGGSIDLVPGRSTVRGGDELLAYFNLALPALRERVRDRFLSGKLPVEDVVTLYDSCGLTVYGRRAGGYLYLTAVTPPVPEGQEWSGEGEVPPVGARVEVISAQAAGTVLAHFANHGFLGLAVDLGDDTPTHILREAKEDGHPPVTIAFGREIRVP